MDIQQDLSSCSWQGETIKSSKVIKDPICLFRQFVSAITSDILKDIQPQSEFLALVWDLCVKAPPVAQHLVQEILKHSTDNFQPEVQGFKVQVLGINHKRSSRRGKQSDLSYRLPKSSKAQVDICRVENKDSHIASSSSIVGDDSSQDKVTINQGSDSLVTEKPLLEFYEDIPESATRELPQEGVQGQSSAHGPSVLPVDSGLALDQLKATCSSDSRQPLVSLDKLTKDRQIIIRLPLPSGAEHQEVALPETKWKASNDQVELAPSLPHSTGPQEVILLDPTPSTPVGQISRGFKLPLSGNQTPHVAIFTSILSGEVLLPLTEGSQTTSLLDKEEMALSERVPSLLSRTGQQEVSPSSSASTRIQQVNKKQQLLTQVNETILPYSLAREPLTLSDMVAKTVHIIYKMSRRQEVPTEIHSRIIGTFQFGLGGTPAMTAIAEQSGSMWITSSPTTWSASMWINMLEAGHARSKEVTILNMIEWIGASEWYDAELEQAEKAPPPTKRGTPRKRLATVVLDLYLKGAPDTTAMESPGKLDSTIGKDPLSSDLAGIQKKVFDTRRKRLLNVLHRGQALRKLIQMTSLGILFDPDIWGYAKASKVNIDKVAASFQADPQKTELLSILDKQVELLAKEGRPDLSRFFDLLESHSITSSEEVSILRAEYSPEKESLPQGCLDTAIN